MPETNELLDDFDGLHTGDEPGGADDDPFGDLGRRMDEEGRAKTELNRKLEGEYTRIFHPEQHGIDEALEPLSDTLKEAGLSKPDAVRRLVAAHQTIERDLAGGLSQIAGLYGDKVAGTADAETLVRRVGHALGVHFTDAATGQQAIAPSQAAQPTPVPQQTQQAPEIPAEVMAGAKIRLDAFVNAKDESGQPKHPHFEAVKPVMQKVLMAAAQSGRTVSLEQAYEASVRAATPAAEAKVERQAKAERARAASTPSTRSSPAQMAEPEDGSNLRQRLEAEAERIFGRD